MTRLVDDTGAPVTLGPRLGRGGEGEVFAVGGRPDLAAKLLAPGHRDGKPAKLTAMLAHVPAGAHDLVEGVPVLTWPRGLLHEGGPTGPVVGYTMARVDAAAFVPFHQVTSAARRRALAGDLGWDRLVLLGLRLSHVVRTLHNFGYAVGDLNDRNVLVSRRLTPLLMDTDSFQVPRGRLGHHACTVGDALYWPPELLGVDLTRYAGDRRAGDRYALGVLLFQLFLGGLRPYQSRGSAVAGLESLEAKTRAGHYPWARPRRGVLEPPANAPDYQALPKPIRAAFERCFVDGHKRPSRRPSAEEWCTILARIHREGYRVCPRVAQHVFARNAPGCPWCRDPNDPFAKPLARPRPTSSQPIPSPPISSGPPVRRRPAAPHRRPTSPPLRQASATRPRGPPQRAREPPTRQPPQAVAAVPAPRSFGRIVGLVRPAPNTGTRRSVGGARPRAGKGNGRGAGRAPPAAPRPAGARRGKRSATTRRSRPLRRPAWRSKIGLVTALTGAILALWWVAA